MQWMSCIHPRPQGKSQGWYSRKRNRQKLPVTYFRGQSLTNLLSQRQMKIITPQ